MRAVIHHFRSMNTAVTSALVCSAVLALTTTPIMSLEPVVASFGNLKDGREAKLITLRNTKGASVHVTNYGGIIVTFYVPDRNGNMDSIVLGKDTLAEYEAGHPFFGALTGRYANRIAKGKVHPGGQRIHFGSEQWSQQPAWGQRGLR